MYIHYLATLLISNFSRIGIDVLNLLVDSWLDRTALIGRVSALQTFMYIGLSNSVYTVD